LKNSGKGASPSITKNKEVRKVETKLDELNF